VSGPGRIVAANGWYATVEPTGMGTVTVEARFNDDEIQPRFVLPVVMPRTIPVRAFVVEPPQRHEKELWEHEEIRSMLDTANEIFTQVGIRFELVGTIANVGTTNDWDISMCDVTTNSVGEVSYSEYATSQFASLLNNYRANDCVEVYFTGSLRNPKMNAVTCPLGVIISKIHTQHTLAHELGHALGLKDILRRLEVDDGGQIITFNLGIGGNVVDRIIFADVGHDWGQEVGRGFYARSDTIASVIDKLLMCGAEDTDSEEVFYGDIPQGQVYGLSKYLEKDYQKVGASDIETSNRKVYSK